MLALALIRGVSQILLKLRPEGEPLPQWHAPKSHVTVIGQVIPDTRWSPWRYAQIR